MKLFTLVNIIAAVRRVEVWPELQHPIGRAGFGCVFIRCWVAAPPETKEARDAARSLRLQLHVLNASNEGEIDAALRLWSKRGLAHSC